MKKMSIMTEEFSETKPNFFLVGAMKAATTSVATALDKHPDVFNCPIKEPNFFCTDINQLDFQQNYLNSMIVDPDDFVEKNILFPVHAAHVKKKKTYSHLFESATGKVAIGEFSTSYLYSTEASKNIHEACPNSKIIIILRNPIERAFSEYLMNVRIGKETRSFSEAVEYEVFNSNLRWGQKPGLYVEAGLYYEQVKRYLDLFRSDQVLILLHEDLCNDFAKIMTQICNHIGVEPISEVLKSIKMNEKKKARFNTVNVFLHKSGIKKFISRYLPNKFICMVKGIYYKSSVDHILSNEEKLMLLKYFNEDICNLSVLISRDLKAWLECK